MKININTQNLNNDKKLHPFSSSRAVRIQRVEGTDEYVASVCNESNDGKFTWKEAGKNFLGGLISPITNMFKSPKNFFIGAGCILAGAAICAVGGAPLLIGAGLVMGGVQAAKAGYKMATAKNGDELEKAFYDAGSATTTLGLSVLGAKMYKGGAAAAEANTTAIATTEGTKSGGALSTFIAGAKSKFSGFSQNTQSTSSGFSSKFGAFANGAKSKFNGFANGAKAKYNNWKSNFKSGSKASAGNNAKTGQSSNAGPKTSTNTSSTKGDPRNTFRQYTADHTTRIRNARTEHNAGSTIKQSTVKDPYEVLGVQRNATPAEIKTAYRNLSKQFHPDKNPNGKEFFQDIQNSYEILNDPAKKTVADFLFDTYL